MIPTRTRWQPLRVGLVDLFYYDYQEFPFRDGRILFRGNNGTGKSKVLALTMPLLLDGDLSPSRVEPDADRAKKMEWNLLLGGRYDERIGYTFLEFGRLTESGEPQYFTIGIGMKAVAGRGIADRWFFGTGRRVGRGHQLELIGPSGSALTRDRLTAAIGEHGQVTRVADQYRRMIDEQLFHLGADRYESLVTMLLQLRQPQLSKKPDEAKLSAALSDALAPVDQAVLSDIARAFHDLEQQRAELTGLRDTSREVTRFVDRYRRYARTAARRQTSAVRTANAGYEAVQRDLAEVGRVIAEATDVERGAEAELTDRQIEQAEQTAIKEELTSDPRLKNLADAERHAVNAQRAAATAVAAAQRAAATRNERAARVAKAEQQAATTAREIDPGPSLRCAEGAGIEVAHQAALAPLNLPDGPYDEDGLRVADRALRTAAQQRAEAVAHLTLLNGKVEQEAAELRTLRAALGQAEAERDAAADRLQDARDDLSAIAQTHVDEWRDFRVSLQILELPDPEETTLALWTETLEGDSPMRTALHAAANPAHQGLAAELAEARAAVRSARDEQKAHVAERDRLTSGEVARPPMPYVRQEGLREGPGAALWQVVDFAPGLPEAERPGLEAALEASGLLDAWITPDGRLLDGDDTVLLATEPVPAGLGSALVPSIEEGSVVTVATVARILAAIGLGRQEAPAWVSVSGRWRLGPLHGSWTKQSAAYIGHTAREEARRRRLAELDALIAALQSRIDAGLEAVNQIEARQRLLAAELTREPRDQKLRDAHGLVTGAVRELQRAETKVGRLADDAAFKQDDLDRASQIRDGSAAELRLPVEPVALSAVSAAVGDHRQAASELLAAARVHLGNVRVLADWRAELQAAVDAVEEAEQAAREAGERAAEEQSRLTALQESIGASVEELRARLDAATRRLRELEVVLKELTGRYRDARERRSRAEGKSELLDTRLTGMAEERQEAVDRLRRFAGTGLFDLACDVPVPESWAATNAVELARRAEEQLKDTDESDEAWRKVQDDISRRYAELAEALSRHGHHAIAGLEDWLLVTVQFQGRQRRPSELAELLQTEIEYRERILSADERNLLEEHLVNDVAGHLQELIADADAQVRRMNEELSERPTSTGMRLRLQWLPDKEGPEGLAEARRRLLRQNPDLWTPDDRTAVGTFLQRQIEAQRARDEQGTWQDHLRRALDYRSWHTFKIERYQDGDWRPGTGPASGGERVLTVSLPLFAAASSKYRSAHPYAPRLVALDEAFAGVDDDARAKCLGLLTTFDLDVVMTSEREWGFYPTVPGLATHHLVRRDGIDAVHVTTWEWDGHRPTKVTAEPGGELF